MAQGQGRLVRNHHLNFSGTVHRAELMHCLTRMTTRQISKPCAISVKFFYCLRLWLIIVISRVFLCNLVVILSLARSSVSHSEV